MKLIFHCLFSIIIFSSTISIVRSQDGILYNSEISQEGYVLCVHDFNTYLIDQCGQIVNTWSAWNMDFHPKLTTTGNIYYIQNGKIIERDWDDNVVVEIEHNVSELKLVYDIVKMSTGNYLVNCRWATNLNELITLGWDSDIGGSNLIDGVVEINPEGEVVWAWHISDHTVQDQVSDAVNFGSVKDNPQLMDIRAISSFDWQFDEAFMFNGIDYNEELDLILISVRKMSEFIIIDHSTTTVEAASNIGGDYEKGGDILYRWGNPKNYNPTTTASRYLYFQHNPNWIEYGEHKGGIIVVNNGLSTNNGSSVIIVNPVIDSTGQFMMEDSVFFPAIPNREIGYEVFDFRSSQYTSGAEVMENGNVYITSGEWDQFIEVTPDDEISWNYKLEGFQYSYRTEKYSKTHPGLVDKDLTAEGTIESPSSEYVCEDFSTSTVEKSKYDVKIFQSSNAQSISLQTVDGSQFSLNGFDLMGRKVLNKTNLRSGDIIDISHLENQIIFLNIHFDQGHIVTRKIYLH